MVSAIHSVRARALTAAAAAAALLAALGLGTAPAGAEPAPAPAPWVATWGAAPQSTTDAADCNPCTIRQVVHTTIGGGTVRLVMSNVLGAGALTIASTNLSLPSPDDAAASLPGTRTQVTFNGGDTAVTIPAGAYLTSDPVALDVAPGSDLQMSMYFPGPSSLNFHRLNAARNTQIWRGADVSEQDAPPTATLVDIPLFVVSGIDVRPAVGDAPPAGAVVVFGDSITDGDGVTADAQAHADARWSDHLAHRLAALPPQDRLGVVNAGIAGNKMLKSNGSAGRGGTARFAEDVLNRAGVRSVIILEGINDILQDSPAPQTLIDALTTMAQQARQHGIHPLAATLTPYKNMSSDREATRQAVNAWIRGTDVFDAVVDFDAAVADPDDPTAMRPGFQKGDQLHPGPLGYAAMGAAIDPAALGTYPRPGTIEYLAPGSVGRGTTIHLTSKVTAAYAVEHARVSFTLPAGWTLAAPYTSTDVDLGPLAAGESAVASIGVVAQTPPDRVDDFTVATAYLDGRATSASLAVRTRPAATTPDTTAPTTTLSFSPPVPSSSGWYTQPVSASAGASDDGTDAPFVEQRVDGGPWQPFVDPVELGDGRHTVEARSVDPAQNVSPVVTAHADVDTVAPRVVAHLDQAGRTVSVTASDATSGVARTEYRTGDGPWLRYRSPLYVGRSAQTLSFRAQDVAGNVSVPQRFVVPAASGSTTVATPSSAKTRSGTAATIAVRVVARDGQVATGGVVVREGATVLAVAVLARGQASLRLPKDLAPGKHTIGVSYPGSESVDPSSTRVSLTVTKASSAVRVTTHRTTTTARAAVSVKVTSKGSAVGKVKVTVHRGGRTVFTKTVRTDGRGRATLRAPRLKHAGTYRVKARFLGSATAAKKSGTARLRVAR